MRKIITATLAILILGTGMGLGSADLGAKVVKDPGTFNTAKTSYIGLNQDVLYLPNGVLTGSLMNNINNRDGARHHYNFHVVTAPIGGTLTLSGNGDFVYVPGPDGGSNAPYFTYNVCEGEICSTSNGTVVFDLAPAAPAEVPEPAWANIYLRMTGDQREGTFNIKDKFDGITSEGSQLTLDFSSPDFDYVRMLMQIGFLNISTSSSSDAINVNVTKNPGVTGSYKIPYTLVSGNDTFTGFITLDMYNDPV